VDETATLLQGEGSGPLRRGGSLTTRTKATATLGKISNWSPAALAHLVADDLVSHYIL
jgi:hypothetical protein